MVGRRYRVRGLTGGDAPGVGAHGEGTTMWPGSDKRSSTTLDATRRFASEGDGMNRAGFAGVPTPPEYTGMPPSRLRRWRASLSWLWGGLAVSLPWRRRAAFERD